MLRNSNSFVRLLFSNISISSFVIIVIIVAFVNKRWIHGFISRIPPNAGTFKVSRKGIRTMVENL